MSPRFGLSLESPRLGFGGLTSPRLARQRQEGLHGSVSADFTTARDTTSPTPRRLDTSGLRMFDLPALPVDYARSRGN